jgi:hypothetical protein
LPPAPASLAQFRSAEQRNGLQKGLVEDWVVEGYKIAREKVYKD